jgi:hypothetical protein
MLKLFAHCNLEQMERIGPKANKAILAIAINAAPLTISKRFSSARGSQELDCNWRTSSSEKSAA